MNENRNDMTQRVSLDNAGQPAARPANPQRRRNTKRWYMTKKEKITLISLASAAAVLLVLAIVIFSLGNQTADDGRILKGVLAAGVDLGGMTREEAAFALEESTMNTYDTMDMIVKVLDEEIVLSPKDTGAKLDIDAVVEAAYNYGRTGSRTERNQAKAHAAQHSVVIPVAPHLNLNTEYINQRIQELGMLFSSTFRASKIELQDIKGKNPSKPVMDPVTGKPDTTVVYQKLTLDLGRTEYGLDTAKLYKQIMDGYNTKIFKVEGNCTVVAPDSIEQTLLDIYEANCWEPIDAKQDTDGTITPEVYGYGFNLEAVKQQIAETDGPVEISMTYLVPNTTEAMIVNGLYKDNIGSNTSPLTTDEAWNTNVNIACQALNGQVIYPGVTFSFNELLGELTAEKGYVEALAWQDRVQTMVMGGGVTHVASVLYASVLTAELEVVEYHNHVYAQSFIGLGLDAYVDGVKDFAFRNNRNNPIRISASVADGILTVNIEGVDTRNYVVEIMVQGPNNNPDPTVIEPETLYTYLLPESGYEHGATLYYGAEGYIVEVYQVLYEKNTESDVREPLRKPFVTTFSYEAQDRIVAQIIQVPATP